MNDTCRLIRWTNRTLVRVLIFPFLVGISTNPQAAEYVPDALYIKFREGAFRETGDGSSVENVLARLGAAGAEPAFTIPRTLMGSGKISADVRDRFASIASIKRVNLPPGFDMVSLAQKLCSSPEVVYAEPIYTHTLHESTSDPYFIVSYQDYLKLVRAPEAWEIAKGDRSVVIAIVDAGTDWNHPDLAANVWTNPGEIPDNGMDDDDNGYVDDVHGWDFFGGVGSGGTIIGDNDPTAPQLAHGTMVAGIAAGVTNNGIGIASLSYNVGFIPIKVGYDDGTGGTLVYAYNAVLYAASLGADVINCSWGSPQYSNVGREIVELAAAMGSLVIASGGNEGRYEIEYPARYPTVLAVGSVDLDRWVSLFSNYGPGIEVCAPGSAILSTSINNIYHVYSGTSMAVPVVSALAALVKSAHRDWDADRIRAQIAGTANPVVAGIPFRFLNGSGYINAERALGESVPYIGVVDYEFTETSGNGDDLFSEGEEIEATVTIRNYGAATHNIQLYTVALFGSLASREGGVSVGTLGHSEEKTISGLAFTVRDSLRSDIREVVILEFESDDGYLNYRTIDLTIGPSFATLAANTMHLSINGIGRLGYTDFPDNMFGVPLVLENEDYLESVVFYEPLLFEGGLIVGTGADRISSALRGTEPGVQDQDFIESAPLLFEKAPNGLFHRATASFSDTGAGTESLGLSVILEATAYSDPGHDRYVILSYTLNNEDSATTVEGLRAGLFLDLDLPDTGSVDDYGFYIPEDDILVIAEDAEDREDRLMVGIAVRGSIATPRLIDNMSTDADDFGIYDGFSDAEKWLSLSAGKTGILERGPGDLSLVISPEAFTLASGEEHEVAFIVAYGLGYDDLRAQIENARYRLEHPVFVEEEQHAAIPERFAITSIYPNPFNPLTTICISLPEPAVVSLDVFDILGRRVQRLYHGSRNSGTHAFTLNGKDLASGLYFVRLQDTGGRRSLRKMMLVK